VQASGTGLEGTVSDLVPGTYRMTLVITGGAAAVGGDTLKGRMWLFPQDSALRTLPAASGVRDTTAKMPFYGATDVDFAAAGAIDTGDPMSRDPERPGVAVLVQRLALAGATDSVLTRVTLRIGAKANRRGPSPFDGGYTALRVHRIERDGFAGTWASGTVTVAARGYFCATREAG